MFCNPDIRLPGFLVLPEFRFAVSSGFAIGFFAYREFWFCKNKKQQQYLPMQIMLLPIIPTTKTPLPNNSSNRCHTFTAGLLTSGFIGDYVKE